MTKGWHSRLNRPRVLKNSRMVSCTYTNGGNSITPLPRIFTRPASNLYNIWLSGLPSRLASSTHPINIWRNHINWPWVLAMHSSFRRQPSRWEICTYRPRQKLLIPPKLDAPKLEGYEDLTEGPPWLKYTDYPWHPGPRNLPYTSDYRLSGSILFP